MINGNFLHIFLSQLNIEKIYHAISSYFFAGMIERILCAALQLSWSKIRNMTNNLPILFQGYQQQLGLSNPLATNIVYQYSFYFANRFTVIFSGSDEYFSLHQNIALHWQICKYCLHNFCEIFFDTPCIWLIYGLPFMIYPFDYFQQHSFDWFICVFTIYLHLSKLSEPISKVSI